MFLWETAATLI